MAICFIESRNFFFIIKTNKKQNLEKEKTKIENKIRKGGNLPTPPHFIHALSSMYSICIKCKEKV